MITGYLKTDSPLRAIFTTGMVPLATPSTARAHLGDAKLTEEVYLIVVARLSTEQKQAMAKRMEEMGQGPFAEALAELEKSHEFPVRSSHFSGVGMPLAAFI